MVDRFKKVYDDIDKYGEKVMLEVSLLAIYKVSAGLYDDAKKEVISRHKIEKPIDKVVLNE